MPPQPRCEWADEATGWNDCGQALSTPQQLREELCTTHSERSLDLSDPMRESFWLS